MGKVSHGHLGADQSIDQPPFLGSSYVILYTYGPCNCELRIVPPYFGPARSQTNFLLQRMQDIAPSSWHPVRKTSVLRRSSPVSTCIHVYQQHALALEFLSISASGKALIHCSQWSLAVEPKSGEPSTSTKKVLGLGASHSPMCEMLHTYEPFTIKHLHTGDLSAYLRVCLHN